MLTQSTDVIGAYPFSEAVDAETLARTAAAMADNGFVVHVVPDGPAAKDLVRSLIPPGAEVHQGASATLDESGVSQLIDTSGEYSAVRPKVWSMDRATQMREIRKLSAAPDVMVGSVNAVTETGTVAIASATGSQLGPYASGAGHVIWVIGAQKIVPDLAAALSRIEEHVLPLEDGRTRKAYGRGSSSNKLLLVKSEPFPGRTTAILVEEPLGF